VADDANANFFEPSIVDSENLLVPTISLYEVFKRVEGVKYKKKKPKKSSLPAYKTISLHDQIAKTA